MNRDAETSNQSSVPAGNFVFVSRYNSTCLSTMPKNNNSQKRAAVSQQQRQPKKKRGGGGGSSARILRRGTEIVKVDVPASNASDDILHGEGGKGLSADATKAGTAALNTAVAVENADNASNAAAGSSAIVETTAAATSTKLVDYAAGDASEKPTGLLMIGATPAVISARDADNAALRAATKALAVAEATATAAAANVTAATAAIAAAGAVDSGVPERLRYAAIATNPFLQQDRSEENPREVHTIHNIHQVDPGFLPSVEALQKQILNLQIAAYNFNARYLKCREQLNKEKKKNGDLRKRIGQLKSVNEYQQQQQNQQQQQHQQMQQPSQYYQQFQIEQTQWDY